MKSDSNDNPLYSSSNKTFCSQFFRGTASVPEIASAAPECNTAVVSEVATAAGEKMPAAAFSPVADAPIFGSSFSPPPTDGVMIGRSNVLSAKQIIDADFALKKVKGCRGIWPFPGSWYYPDSGPKLSSLSSKDPNKYFDVPVLLIMPLIEFRNRFDTCPCAEFGYKHSRVYSHGYTDPCRVVGADFSYAMIGNRYLCLDCKALGLSDVGSYTFNSYDERFLALLPPDIG